MSEYRGQSRKLDKRLLKAREGVEEDRGEPGHRTGRGGEPSREQRAYRPDRTLMPDKAVATMKYSHSLEEVE